MIHDYEAIGRYHVAVQDARRLVGERNSLLGRVALVLKNSSDTPPPGALGKRCNFAAVHTLLSQAQALDEALQARLGEINDLAPLADLAPMALA